MGSGGLVRAYGGTAAACLRQAAKTEIVVRSEGEIVADFSEIAVLKARLCALPGFVILKEEYTATGAVLSVALPDAAKDQANRLVTDISRGRTAIRFADD